IVHGENPSPGECVPFFILTVDQNDPEGGIVSYQPVQDYYSEGTEVTLAAQANPGYFFQSWSGDEPNAEAVFTFSMTNNVHATAIFLPAGTRMFPDAVGYATVQDDKGTPFMVFGGALGDSVFATSINELQTYLGSENPLIVTFSDSFFASMEINIKSNKTLLGVGDKAHLSGIGLNINGASNVILKNLTVSKVSPQDAVEINGKSRQILIDHCEFYSDRNHGTEFYDGLLDIKNESSFITVSWSKFHDHFKTILISSNDQSPQDSVTRVTFHHNYFYNCGSRLPSIRFGTAHIFNNYYENCESAINTRMGARVRIEKNYFFHTGNAVASDYSIKPGMVQLFDNIFVSSSYITEPTCEVGIPYDYEYLLNEPEELPRLLGGDVSAVDRISKLPLKYDICSYPNPFNPAVNINFTVPSSAHVEIDIFNALGQRIIKLADKYYSEGEHIIKWNAGSQASGIYYYRLKSEDFVDVKKMVLIR
ncbi:T9SS type A sorting domain-containing protein, partial [candidate division KSB1 bacterium]|nr:T9SS type A sorting domain-containing protein [candidate division KSB1 bacterium]